MKKLRRRLVLTTLVIGSLGARAQSQDQDRPPAFEVASIKLARSGPVKIQFDLGRLTICNEIVEALINLAYGLREHQFVGPQLAAYGAP